MSVDFHAALFDVAKCLRHFLSQSLPKLSKDWWEERVLAHLYQQQRNLAQQQDSNSLKGLDLAALLHVMANNWHELADELHLPIAGLNYLHEMRNIRNNVAHPTGIEPTTQDKYRDLDTIVRFLHIIDAEEDVIAKWQTVSEQLLLQRLAPKITPTLPAPEAPPPAPEVTPPSTYALGQLVSLRSNPDTSGAVIAVLPGGSDMRYQVFVDNKVQIYYESQLQAAAETNSNLTPVELNRFHAALSSIQIHNPSISTLYSLNAARIDYIPYQYRPVLKFVQAERPRLLIADSVGVGKTIEAGLILRELQARRDLQSVLIICPKALVVERKWEFEMRRFDERFTALKGEQLRYCLNTLDFDGEWPHQYEKCIVPYSLCTKELLEGSDRRGGNGSHPGVLKMDPPPHFDLIIVDEAHHIRNTETAVSQVVRSLCEQAEAVVFLTATPIQLGDKDLFVLLNTLRPDLVIDRESFQHMGEPNPYINQAVDAMRTAEDGWGEDALEALNNALDTAWGQTVLQRNPQFMDVLNTLKNGPMSPEKRVEAIHSLEQAHSFAGIINRTRRRDIGDFTIRRPETVEIHFTPAQRKLHDALLTTHAQIMAKLHGDKAVRFLMSTIRRQAASCIFGLAPHIGDILLSHIDELTTSQLDEEVIINEKTVTSIADNIITISAMADNLPPEDPKLDALLSIIADRQRTPNNKLMVFSTFRHTLGYLLGKLKNAGIRTGLIHGGVKDDERIALRDRFRLDRTEKDAIDVLLFSEIGCEGVDYQFCDCMVNYDLPWNPMRVEQRIGRIDRNGQKSEFVSIYNLITPDTVDADIYERCLLRIGVFEHSLGGSEEILGQIARDIENIAEDHELTSHERKTKLQQLADNKIRLIKEQQMLEERQAELFGLRFADAKLNDEIEAASNFWVSPQALENLVTEYFEKLFATDQEYIIGSKEMKQLRLSKECRAQLLDDFKKLQSRKHSGYVKWERWLKGGEQLLPITFDASCANENADITLITPIHPLIRQAAEALQPDTPMITSLSVVDETVEPGNHPFAIYQWQYLGIHNDMELKPVCASPQIADKLLEYLQQGEPIPQDAANMPDQTAFDALEEQHHPLWEAERKAHKEQTIRIVNYQKESLRASHQARVAMLEERISNESHEKIRRMVISQINRANADYERHEQELHDATEKADITAQPVAFGILTITGSGTNAK